jgi:Tol biopolymer transport system component
VPADGHSKVWITSPDGGAPEALTSGEHGEHDPTWSPDGSAVMLDYRGNSPDSSIQVLNLKTHTVTELPASKGISSPRWSPDGRYVAALTSGDLDLMLFDFKTQKWEKLSDSSGSFPNWSRDGKYVFFGGMAGAAPGFYRVDIATHEAEEVAGLGEAHAVNCVARPFPWFRVAPDGSPLIAHGTGTQEIYALDVDFP